MSLPSVQAAAVRLGLGRTWPPSVVRPSVIAAAKFATVKGKIHPSPARALARMHALKCSDGRPTDGLNGLLSWLMADAGLTTRTPRGRFCAPAQRREMSNGVAELLCWHCEGRHGREKRQKRTEEAGRVSGPVRKFRNSGFSTQE